MYRSYMHGMGFILKALQILRRNDNLTKKKTRSSYSFNIKYETRTGLFETCASLFRVEIILNWPLFCLRSYIIFIINERDQPSPCSAHLFPFNLVSLKKKTTKINNVLDVILYAEEIHSKRIMNERKKKKKTI
jgi:hypothetical protein